MLNPVLPSILFVLLTTVVPQAPPRPPAGSVRIATVQVKGTVRYVPEEVARLSGLAIGQSATVEDLPAAANKLASTGLFDTVKYSYTTAGTQMTVTFDIEEAPWDMGLILDNFVWFSDDEVIAAVKKDVPSFAVKDPSPTICALRVQGAAAVPERDLLEPVGGIIGGDYSRFFITTARRFTKSHT